MHEPVLLVAGGSGVVPLMAMVRHRAAAGATAPMRLLHSVRSPDDVIYGDELARRAAAGDGGGFELFHTFTRVQPPEWRGYSRRIDRQMLGDVIRPLERTAQAYVCGPTSMVEAVANTLVALDLPPHRVRTERFGPTGGVIQGGPR